MDKKKKDEVPSESATTLLVRELFGSGIELFKQKSE